ncbi:phosphonate ABC transporter, permease protein PhnE [Gloeocapsopsis dulcis]|uniref:Phosphonate ABC transporter, permease protein PhnE n=1 Tax=Gloeocapsopsis dulcis AAB1 = 1H9 TaxID=1433147 RepID=A0A6N8FT75_9CHRO|nr:phosphonate ABC transporter, permease protein PhnE [Gloeocapsopsis dulcis]MUL36059.1 phosphonate ABC transporter, permease protein PhnE [Gloeocapsopsis dulcis AAB1 = 1H9]WNN91472.1 phosphonate ABC transporter, permease protein PhnE [Gloeocapsopsis dulcis]
MTFPFTKYEVDRANYSPDLDAILATEQRRQGGVWRLLHRSFWGVLAIALLIASARTAKVDLLQFWQRIPTVGEWLSRLFPPDFSELLIFFEAIWETLAIAIVGTGCAILVAVPLALLVARNITPVQSLATPLRGLLNLLRGIDTAIFALFFVSIVGLGPFAGALGVAFHTTGSMAKLYAEVLESLPSEPIEAVEATGSDRLRTFAFAVLPEALPGLIGISLYLWEFNVRSSVILGIVGAGGIGYELLVSLKLLDFPRLCTILLLILAMVSLIDALSAYFRQRLN